MPLENENPNPQTEAPTEAPATFKVKVDGAEHTVTADELIATYQKNRAADARLEEASRIAKENATAVEVYQNLMASTTGNKDALRKAALKLGFDANTVDEYMKALEEGTAGAGNPAPAATPAAPASAAAIAAETGLDAGTVKQLKAFLGVMTKEGVDPSQVAAMLSGQVRKTGEDNLTEYIRDAIAKDEVLRYHSSGASGKVLPGLVEDAVMRRLVKGREQLTPETIAAAIRETRSRVEAFGAAGNGDGGGLLGMSPGGGSPAGPGHRGGKPVTRPDGGSSQGLAYDNYIGGKLAEALREPASTD